MARNKVYYSGSSMPTGTRTLDVYRPTDPTAVATPSANSTKILTAVLVEDMDISEDATTIRRRGTKGEPTDVKLIAGLKTMTGTFQMATATEQYFVTKAAAPEKAEDARKQSLTLEIDFNQSVRWA